MASTTATASISFDDGSRIMEQKTDASSSTPARNADFDLLSYYDAEATVASFPAVVATAQ